MSGRIDRGIGRGVISALLLSLSGCALARYSETPEGQPVYVLSQPMCLVVCASDFGTIRSGDGASGLSLAQSASAGAGAVTP